MMPWLRFFRIVNLPTVPGDVLVGAAALLAASRATAAPVAATPAALAGAAAAACLLYLFGLADNDIAGAKSDGPGRPVPAGEISLAAARVARGACLAGAILAGFLADLPPVWWNVAFALAVLCVVYNRTKGFVAMGLCRGLNVLCGGAALVARPAACGVSPAALAAPLAVAFAFALYISAVTKYSEGEEADAAKRLRVGLLVGALVYLQLLALLAAYLLAPCVATRNLLLAGAALLAALRLVRRILPKVSAS